MLHHLTPEKRKQVRDLKTIRAMVKKNTIRSPAVKRKYMRKKDVTI